MSPIRVVDCESFAYNAAFTGGVFVAAGDLNGDQEGLADIVTGAEKGGGPHVKVFGAGNGANLLGSFFAYAPQFTGGVRVGAGRSLAPIP